MHVEPELHSTGAAAIIRDTCDYMNSKTLEGHWSCVEAVIELGGSYDGLLCSVSSDKTMRIWLDPQKTAIEFHPELIIRGHSLSVTAVLQLADERICTGSKDGLIKIWDQSKDWATGQCDKTLRGHHKGINTLICLRKEERLCSGSDDRTVMVWDLTALRSLCVLESHSGPVLCVIESRNGLICSASADHTLILWKSNAADAFEGSQVTAGAGAGSASTRYASPSSKGSTVSSKRANLASVKLKGYDLKAVISEAESYRVQNSLITRGHKAAVNCVIELLDGRLCSCGDDKMIKFWDPVRCVCDLTMEGHWAAVNCVVQLRSGLLCTCGNDRMIKLWHLTRFTKKSISTPDDHCVLTLTGHAGVVRKVAERRNGTLISCGDDNTVRIWAPEPG